MFPLELYPRLRHKITEYLTQDPATLTVEQQQERKFLEDHQSWVLSPNPIDALDFNVHLQLVPDEAHALAGSSGIFVNAMNLLFGSLTGRFLSPQIRVTFSVQVS